MLKVPNSSNYEDIIVFINLWQKLVHNSIMEEFLQIGGPIFMD